MRPPRIARVDIIPVEVPRTGTFDLQRGRSAATSPFTVVRVTADDGAIGYGEGVTRVRSMHTVLTDHLADLLVGRDPFDLTGIHRAMDAVELVITERLSHWNPVRSAIDMALYDLQGKSLGLPVYQLLGGKQRDSIEVVKNVGVGDPEGSARDAAQLVEEGYPILKMRVGTDPDLDLARVKAVREAVGPDVRIRVDANQAWDAKTAVWVIERLAEYGLEAVEQPCKYWDLRGGREVVERVDVPIIADEGFWTVDDAQNVLSARAADVLHIYLGKCGGIFPSMKIAAVAESFDARVTLGERVPLGISEAAHCQVGAALRELRFPCALAYGLNEHDLLATPVRKEQGRMYVPEGPGLGVEIDEEKLAFYTRR